ncbi:FMN-dependent NADH-azoreductase [Paenarthrobacter aurescens]|uniref:FMN dependent NADH:quinone oxidoreductase n=1 Tax=Paenarthrobacter aurescens TaxID=43663 RepID=A0A4Y3NAS2_PAEAU|nr:NAD(P)H-dependent oxidoreductase [Paenarthrobacter aurescens]MDO6144854.1 NAD(P)H-dependent oxidoreductase [Paenarthrobacter aurescens]MDO6148699.1 NAD(P)H-dependent oxidoreductase [Paenarthrobacter aurescens]MDO6159945.1 NAD(P)H-dependent oxidoreductase [Paenarthrobacter aurescens]MDO6163804.1 NAD(P)H-dependent oxidoreductase [Paenarthrobacter aurescens]GEB17485.1 FMN-dependent NADH-azoreductase [Paenarthrobacter aurescens]
MPSILHINASPRYAHSDSLRLAHHFLDSVQAAVPETFEVETVNLFDDGALPAFGRTAAAAKMAVFTGRDQSPEQMAAWESARAVFDQFAAADAYVFNIPMWNAGVPYVLKQWIDIITQPGWSFGFHPEQGYTGLMQGKHAVAIHTSGVYAHGVPAAFGSDFSSTFFADWLNFVGISDATHIRFAPTVLNADVEGTRRLAEADLSDAALLFAGKLEALELVRD